MNALRVQPTQRWVQRRVSGQARNSWQHATKGQPQRVRCRSFRAPDRVLVVERDHAQDKPEPLRSKPYRTHGAHRPAVSPLRIHSNAQQAGAEGEEGQVEQAEETGDTKANEQAATAAAAEQRAR